MLVSVPAFLVFRSCSKPAAEEFTVTHDMVVNQIEKLGRLEVVKYNIQDLMEYKKKRKWLPDSKTSLKIVGEVTGCVDLAKLRPADIRVIKDSVAVLLPEPEICNYKIDHSKSGVYNMEYGLWETTEIVDEAYKAAEKKLFAEARNMGIAKESRQNAVKVLTPILSALGFKKVYVGFKAAEKGVVEGTPVVIRKE